MDKKIFIESPELPKSAPIIDYPISVASVDPSGNYIINTDTGEFVSTGETMEWSIRPGEKLVFEEYVAKILTDRYHFLKLICSKCEEVFRFEAIPTGASKSAYENYLQHDCQPKGKVSKEEIEVAKNATESNVLYCRICNDGKEYKGKTQLGMHLGSQHPTEFAEMIK